jgi:hypothetical protein
MDNIMLDLVEIWRGGVAQVKDKLRAVVNAVMNLRVS